MVKVLYHANTSLMKQSLHFSGNNRKSQKRLSAFAIYLHTPNRFSWYSVQANRSNGDIFKWVKNLEQVYFNCLNYLRNADPSEVGGGKKYLIFFLLLIRIKILMFVMRVKSSQNNAHQEAENRTVLRSSLPHINTSCLYTIRIMLTILFPNRVFWYTSHKYSVELVLSNTNVSIGNYMKNKTEKTRDRLQ